MVEAVNERRISLIEDFIAKQLRKSTPIFLTKEISKNKTKKRQKKHLMSRS
jgi:hypothetical protein